MVDIRLLLLALALDGAVFILEWFQQSKWATDTVRTDVLDVWAFTLILGVMNVCVFKRYGRSVIITGAILYMLLQVAKVGVRIPTCTISYVWHFFMEGVYVLLKDEDDDDDVHEVHFENARRAATKKEAAALRREQLHRQAAHFSASNGDGFHLDLTAPRARLSGLVKT